MSEKAFQDAYPDELSHCYGCGRLNPDGLQLKSYWDGDETVAHFRPRPSHMAIPGYVYGGLLASLIDCHAAGTASAARAREDGIDPDVQPLERFVTASLKVDYLAPAPVAQPLEIRARVREIKGRKVWLDATLSANGTVCARGDVLMIQIVDK